MLGERMEAEIREQAETLARNATLYLDAAKAYLTGRRFDMVLLAARGSSDNAALYARYLIEIHLGVPVSLAAPSVLTRYRSQVRYTNCLAIGISQSGAAPDVAEVLAYAREGGHATLAVTNTPGSTLTSTAEATILLEVGPELAVAATKTYTASLLAMVQVVRALGGAVPEPVGLMSDADVGAAGHRAEADAALLLESSPVFTLARGYSYATAQETALKLMECALVPAKSYSTADFMHGPKALANPDSLLINFGDPLPSSLAGGFRQMEYLDDMPEALRPIREILHGQWLALQAARLRGLDPDHPQNLTKVTKTL